MIFEARKTIINSYVNDKGIFDKPSYRMFRKTLPCRSVSFKLVGDTHLFGFCYVYSMMVILLKKLIRFTRSIKGLYKLRYRT